MPRLVAVTQLLRDQGSRPHRFKRRQRTDTETRVCASIFVYRAISNNILFVDTNHFLGFFFSHNFKPEKTFIVTNSSRILLWHTLFMQLNN